MKIYSSVNYALGATPLSEKGAMKLANIPEPKTPAQAATQLEKMRNSLSNWLRMRRATDSRSDTDAQARRLWRERRNDEQALAGKLHALLRQAGFSVDVLPIPDVTLDPNAALELAELVISGETPTPVSQGIFMLLIPIAGLAWIISSAIKSQADLAAEKERLRCIQSGACTDYGFWLKAGGISLVALLAWKLGGEKLLKKA